MRQNVGVVATGVFQRVGQDRQPVEGTLGVDRLRNTANGAVAPGEPCGIELNRSERVPDYLAGGVGKDALA